MPDATAMIDVARPPPSIEVAAASAGLSAAIPVRVWLFGWISRMTATREATFELPVGATVADVLTALGQRFGETMRDELMRTRKEKSSACRISLNGRLVHDLDAPLGTQAAVVEIIVLSAYEGG
jgi:molybdopterin converting factor small subunit